MVVVVVHVNVTEEETGKHARHRRPFNDATRCVGRATVTSVQTP